MTRTVTGVLAPNPGPFTLEGTNTWVVRAGGASVVVDPGPADPAHLAAVTAVACAGGAEIALVVLTHGHADHTEGAREFAQSAAAPIRAVDPQWCSAGEPPLSDAEVLTVGDGPGGAVALTVLLTPGHTGDSLALWLPVDRALLTGDTVLGRGTSVVAHPDGDLGAYLESLRRLRAWCADHDVTTMLPGHGPELGGQQVSPTAVLDGYLRHREERLEQVRAAVAAGAGTPGEVVDAVYVGLAEDLRPLATASAAAQLAYLGVGCR